MPGGMRHVGLANHKTKGNMKFGTEQNKLIASFGAGLLSGAMGIDFNLQRGERLTEQQRPRQFEMTCLDKFSFPERQIKTQEYTDEPHVKEREILRDCSERFGHITPKPRPETEKIGDPSNKTELLPQELIDDLRELYIKIIKIPQYTCS